MNGFRVLNVTVHHTRSVTCIGEPRRSFFPDLQRVTVDFEVTPEALESLMDHIREQYGYRAREPRDRDPGIPMLEPRTRMLPQGPIIHDAYFDEDDDE